MTQRPIPAMTTAMTPPFAMRAAACAVVSGCILLSACSAGPDYRRPEAPSTEAFKADARAADANWKPAQPRDDLPRGAWWTVFGDAQLDALVAQVDLGNQDLRAAEARYRQARAIADQSRAGLYPSATASLSTTRSRSPSGTLGGTTAGRIVTSRSVGIDSSWEADVWGKLSATVDANRASAQASAADLANARLSAQAELAQAYFNLRVLDVQRHQFDEAIAAYQRALALTRNRYAAGVAARVDVVQAETQLASTRAQAVDLGVQRAQLENAIALLLGKPPAAFSLPRLDKPMAFAARVPDVPAGLPSELLERRPDIAAAERRVAAANAQIGIAQAAFFPALTLSGNVGSRASDMATWLTTPSRFWSIGPALAMTVLDFGRRQAATDQAAANYELTVATYRQAVLTGFQEVEDNLAALRVLEEEAALQDEAVRAARLTTEITLNQYKAGTVSFLNVTTAQATQLANERAAISLQGRRLIAAVQLVRALGGGWEAASLANEPVARERK